jgi:uncharacterized DUF497 family protein
MPHIAMCQALRRPHPLSRSRVALCRELRLPAVSDEWDNGKAAENLRKHGVDFVDAIAALEDLNRLEELDAQIVSGEERIQVLGMAQVDVLFVIVTLRGEDSCRIISARKATRHEQDRYRETW